MSSKPLSEDTRRTQVQRLVEKDELLHNDMKEALLRKIHLMGLEDLAAIEEMLVRAEVEIAHLNRIALDKANTAFDLFTLRVDQKTTK